MDIHARSRSGVGRIEKRFKPIKHAAEGMELTVGLEMGFYAVQIIS